MIQSYEVKKEKFGENEISFKMLEILCELAIKYPDVPLDQISQEVYNEIESAILKFISSFKFSEIKSKRQRKKDLLKLHRMPKKSKEKLKKEIEYESKIKIFRDIQNNLKKLNDTSINFYMEDLFERNKSESTNDILWRKKDINKEDIFNDVVDVSYNILPSDLIKSPSFSDFSFYINQNDINLNKLIQGSASINEIEKKSQVKFKLTEFEDKLSDFEYGMFPKGDPAFDKFIPGKFNLKIPHFTFRKEKENEIGIFMEPIIDEDSGE
ncbi:MAG: hypothetical protein ACTSRP_22795 [Candidatus Helarchaeota archaeon]